MFIFSSFRRSTIFYARNNRVFQIYIFLFLPLFRADLFRVLVRFNVTTSSTFNLLATPFGQSNKAQEIKERISGR